MPSSQMPSSKKKTASNQSEKASGKELLVNAALQLAATSRSIHSLSLREISREAGLNHNTFYRHFSNIEEIGLYIIQNIASQLRQPLVDLRYHAYELADKETDVAKDADQGYDVTLQQAFHVNQVTVELFFNFVDTNPNAFIFGVRELHGPSQVLRNAIRQVLKEFSDDMSRDIQALNLLPTLDKSTIDDISQMLIPQLFQLSLDYIEYDQERQAIRDMAQSQIRLLFAGAVKLKKLVEKEN